ncbi:MAG TPA: hypothetical protein VKG22_01535 [Stellaceae bacterium]|nr:hypothetical protein [Stellaceae bacterium]
MRKWLCTGLLAAAVALPALSGAVWAGGSDDLGCSDATLKGAYAFSVLTIVAAAPVGPGVVVGLTTFDGKGGLTQIDYPGNGGTDLGLDEKFRTGQTGSYTVNPNCTGFMTVNLGSAVGVTENAFVISNGGRAVRAVIASFTAPNGALATPLQSRIDFWKVASEQDTEDR